MTIYVSISSWSTAYRAVQTSAAAARETVETNPGTRAVARWPNTTGADVIAIAAVFDPYIRMHSLYFGGTGLARRWSAATDDIERFALTAPRAVYCANRAFWQTVLAACVYLDAQGSPLPPAHVWAALCELLAEPTATRNAGPRGDGPFQHFDNVHTFDGLFVAQLKHLRALRGSDDRDPDPGASGGKKPIPRTTNADVVLLADYWSAQLASAKEVFGASGVRDRWQAALADVDANARHGDPSALYPKNNAFWRALQETAIHVAAADEAPTKTDLMLDSLKDSLAHLPENLKAGAQAVAEGAASVAGKLAHGVGEVAHEAGKGLFGGFGAPLLVGAGLVGLYLISRNSNHTEASS